MMDIEKAKTDVLYFVEQIAGTPISDWQRKTIGAKLYKPATFIEKLQKKETPNV